MGLYILIDVCAGGNQIAIVVNRATVNGSKGSKFNDALGVFGPRFKEGR